MPAICCKSGCTCGRHRGARRGKPVPKNQKYDHARIQQLYDEGFNDAEIARRVGVTTTKNSRNTVKEWRKRYGLPPNGSIGRPVTDLTGFRFGKLTVLRLLDDRYISPLGDKSQSVTRWLCACDCGSETEVLRGNLTKSQGTRSCGCGRKLPSGDAARNKLLAQYKTCAARRGYVWALSDEGFYQLTSKVCHYCGSQPSSVCKADGGDYVYNGVDRRDNSEGYVVENCVSSCGVCNRAKHSMSEHEFLMWIDNLVSYRQESMIGY